MVRSERPSLQSKDGHDILDIVDSLRSQGISQYVDLPQIIVCGDQSSGKSSVLEAISGMTFPTKDALCTRFATELILRRTIDEHNESLKVSIIPGPDRTDEECRELEQFKPDVRDLNLSSVVDNAMEVMGLTGTHKAFCTDILRVEVSSPTQPHLTLVDLPGLFLAGNKDQSMEDAKLVESLVLSYMEQPRSIILAVVSAKSEFALQQVTQRAREMDPEGHRTLGLITKPDTLHEGSESERAYLELAKNTDVDFRLGWHVLRNRDFHTRHASNAERDATEKAFFSQGVWISLNRSHVGIDALRSRLSRVLHDQILTHLPLVLQDIQSGIAECRMILDKLGVARDSTGEQRRYLLQVSQTYTTLVRASIDGDYSNRLFFGDSATPSGYEKRLRAQVQNTLIKFAEIMRLRGHAKTIVDAEKAASEETQPPKILRSRFVREVNDLIRSNRGCELPGTFNPLLIGEMFSTQCQPWADLAQQYVVSVFSSVRMTLLAALKYAADDETAERLKLELIEPKINDLEASVESKLAELLEPHNKGHPVTYNHYFTENIQKAQQARHERKLRSTVEAFFEPSSTKLTKKEFVPADLFSALTRSTQPNMESYASTLAIDMMEAYYKVRPVNYYTHRVIKPRWPEFFASLCFWFNISLAGNSRPDHNTDTLFRSQLKGSSMRSVCLR